MTPTGPIRIRNRALLIAKANNIDDPRCIFYRVMLWADTFETYLREIGNISVKVVGFKNGPISGQRELMYCLRNGWIGEDQAQAA
jgi:hypothetical protein